MRQLAEQGPDWNGVLAELLGVLHRVAIAQALPEAVDNGQGDREQVLALAQALPAEDVQFYYQMGLIGRRDLPLAPEPRGGFEMVLLRMLAFRPADIEGAPGSPLKPLGISQATADSAKTPVAGAAPAASPVIASAPAAQAAVLAELPDGRPSLVAGEAAAMLVPNESPPDLPWNEKPQPEQPSEVHAEQVKNPATEPVAEQVSNPPVAVQATSDPEPQSTPQAEAKPVVDQVAPTVEASASAAEAGADDDEPPPGEYDYYEADAESLDYDFDAPAAPDVAEPEPLPASRPATGLAAEWLELFPQLGISGLTGSIGANCSLVAREGDTWTLHLDPAHSALFNPTQQRRLNDALDQQLGRAVTLHVEIRTPEQETPAQAAARKRAERQRQAEASIHADPLVQQMIQQFAAVIREDSIEPLNT